MELTKERSQQQADIINLIGMYVPMLDTEYLSALAIEIRQQSSRQESLAVLNPSYAPSKNELLNKHADALKLLARYIETLKECEALKAKVKQEDSAQNMISSLFL